MGRERPRPSPAAGPERRARQHDARARSPTDDTSSCGLSSLANEHELPPSSRGVANARATNRAASLAAKRYLLAHRDNRVARISQRGRRQREQDVADPTEH